MKKVLLNWFKQNPNNIHELKKYICARTVEAERESGNLFDTFWYGLKGYKLMSKKETIEQILNMCEDMRDLARIIKSIEEGDFF